MLKPLLAEHPRLFGAALRHQRKYNAALSFIQNPPAGCQVAQLCPSDDFPVARFTRDAAKLNAGYQQGVEQAQGYLRQVMQQAPVVNDAQLTTSMTEA